MKNRRHTPAQIIRSRGRGRERAVDGRNVADQTLEVVALKETAKKHW